MTVGQINEQMSAKELTEWMIFYTIEPFGPAREDYRAALQCSITASAAGAKTQPSDFIPMWSFAEEQQARLEQEEQERFSRQQEAQMAILKAMMGASTNGKT
jgi:hypothetical protein